MNGGAVLKRWGSKIALILLAWTAVFLLGALLQDLTGWGWLDDLDNAVASTLAILIWPESVGLRRMP